MLCSPGYRLGLEPLGRVLEIYQPPIAVAPLLFRVDLLAHFFMLVLAFQVQPLRPPVQQVVLAIEIGLSNHLVALRLGRLWMRAPRVLRVRRDGVLDHASSVLQCEGTEGLCHAMVVCHASRGSLYTTAHASSSASSASSSAVGGSGSPRCGMGDNSGNTVTFAQLSGFATTASLTAAPVCLEKPPSYSRDVSPWRPAFAGVRWPRDQMGDGR
eukprot:COSAG03_NODE_3804_length_1822_cov_2.834591_1_plen_213_part_00